MDGVMKEVKMGMGREWRLPGLLYVDDLVLCGESEDGLRVMVERMENDRIAKRVCVGEGSVLVVT